MEVVPGVVSFCTSSAPVPRLLSRLLQALFIRCKETATEKKECHRRTIQEKKPDRKQMNDDAKICGRAHIFEQLFPGGFVAWFAARIFCCCCCYILAVQTRRPHSVHQRAIEHEAIVDVDAIRPTDTSTPALRS